MRKLVVVLLGMVSGCYWLAQAQTQCGFVSSVEVRVVNVEVTVTGADGAGVDDLQPEEFEISEDGVPQRMTNFYRVRGGMVQLDEAQRAQGLSQEDERFRRRLVLVVDNNFLSPTLRRRALGEVRQFVADRWGGDAEWAIAAIGEELQYLQPFTRDRFQILAALEAVDALPTYGSRHALDRSLLNDPIRQQFLQGGAEPGRTSAFDAGAGMRFSSREQARRNLQSFAVMARVLGGLMRSYAGFGGRKAVALVSGPMEMHPEMQYLVSRDERTRADTGLTDRTQSDPGIEATRRQLEEILAALVRGANSAGFQIYTLAAGGLTSPARLHDVSNRQLGRIRDTGAFAAPVEVSDVDTAPRTLSEGTGGLALRSNRLGEDLVRVVEDNASYYSLGYQPEREPDGQFHRISVRVKRPGVKVRHREGYLDLSEGEKLAEALRTSLAFPKPKGPIPVRLDVREVGQEAGKVRLAAHVAVEIGSLSLVPALGGGERGEVEVLLAIYDERGENLSVVSQSFPFDVPPGQGEAARAGDLKPTLTFTLPAGAYTVSVTVWDPLIREHGTALAQVRVGDGGR